jgi:hypothetical protein
LEFVSSAESIGQSFNSNCLREETAVRVIEVGHLPPGLAAQQTIPAHKIERPTKLVIALDDLLPDDGRGSSSSFSALQEKALSNGRVATHRPPTPSGILARLNQSR